MATKCITITNDAYERLVVFKKYNESFSDVINKITKGFSILDLAGILTNKEADELSKHIEEGRKEIAKRRNKIKF